MWKSLFGGSQGLLLRSLRGTEWQQFLDYVSPSFLEVMPVSHLLAQGREIAANATQGERFGVLRDGVDAELAARDVPVRLVAAELGASARAIDELDETERRELGQRALEIYFAQLFGGEEAILDLRGARFARREESWLWFPRPFYLRWDAGFLAGIRDLYAGFYRDDDDRFAQGLAQLDLTVAGDVFQSHFGEGDQREVRFDSRVFHSTFHEAFVRCRDEGVTLHQNFLALGLYLACLYDVLETLDLAFDVRAAFDRVTS